MPAKDSIRVDGEKIRELRLQRDWSLDDLARHVGRGAPHLSRIENGHRVASPRLTHQLARAFGVPITDLTRKEDADVAHG